MTIAYCLLWNAGKQVQFPLHLLGFVKINPYGLSKQGMLQGCSRSALTEQGGNLRWEEASWVTALWVGFCSMLLCNPFHKAAAFHSRVGKSSYSSFHFKLL